MKGEKGGGGEDNRNSKKKGRKREKMNIHLGRIFFYQAILFPSGGSRLAKRGGKKAQ